MNPALRAIIQFMFPSITDKCDIIKKPVPQSYPTLEHICKYCFPKMRFDRPPINVHKDYLIVTLRERPIGNEHNQYLRVWVGICDNCNHSYIWVGRKHG